MLYSFLRAIAALILKIIFHLEVKGKENIPQEGGFILASNHISYLDPIALGVACPRRLNYMARHDLFDKPLFGWLLSHICVFPVKRDSVDLSAIKEAIRRLKDGKGLVLFPECARQTGAAILEPRSGVGFLAKKLGVPVIPAFVKGTEGVLPKGAKTIRINKISIYFGRQVSVERRMHYHDIAKAIMQDIRLLS